MGELRWEAESDEEARELRRRLAEEGLIPGVPVQSENNEIPRKRFPFVHEYAHITPQIMIEATQFLGWETAKAIHSWLGGRRIFYVPQGFTHPLRRPEEWAVDGSIVYEDAPEFLVVRTPLENMRCGFGDYIIRDINGDDGMGVVSEEAFRSNYMPIQ